MKQIYKDRLLKLANFLETLHPKKFDLSVFVIEPASKISKEYATNKVKPCGTAACAIGWCPVVFPRSCYYNTNDDIVLKKNPKFSNFGFAEIFFNLTENESRRLFSSCEYYNFNNITPKRVAKRIRKLVKDK